MRSFVIGLLGFIGYAGGTCAVAILMRWLIGDVAGTIAAVTCALLFIIAADWLKWFKDEPTSHWYDDVHVMD